MLWPQEGDVTGRWQSAGIVLDWGLAPAVQGWLVFTE